MTNHQEEEMYTFKTWEEDYIKRKTKLKKVLSINMGKLVKTLEQTTELDATIIQQLNQMIKKVKYQVNKLWRLGKKFPLDIQDFPIEMMLFNHKKHQNELSQLRKTLQQIHQYNNNKENLQVKQIVQWFIYIMKCASDIIME